MVEQEQCPRCRRSAEETIEGLCPSCWMLDSFEHGKATVCTTEFRVPLNFARAEYVRWLRCKAGFTWRAVASHCNDQWFGDWGTNQIAGMAICETAALLLGEDPSTGPWN